MTATVPERSARARGLPGAEGFWVFVGGDLAVFTLLFFSFLDARGDDRSAFEAGRAALDLDRGGINTLVLLTSSLVVALALVALREGSTRRAGRLLALGALGGVVFAVLKLSEYVATIRAGGAGDEFHSYYFAITGLHLAHVVGGTVVLVVLALACRRGSGPRPGSVQTAACYWHLVDLLWIVIFPLLYLVRGGGY